MLSCWSDKARHLKSCHLRDSGWGGGNENWSLAAALKAHRALSSLNASQKQDLEILIHWNKPFVKCLGRWCNCPPPPESPCIVRYLTPSAPVMGLHVATQAILRNQPLCKWTAAWQRGGEDGGRLWTGMEEGVGLPARVPELPVLTGSTYTPKKKKKNPHHHVPSYTTCGSVQTRVEGQSSVGWDSGVYVSTLTPPAQKVELCHQLPPVSTQHLHRCLGLRLH